MAKKTKNTDKKSVLSNWFFKQPAKFALLSFGLLVGVAIIFSLIQSWMYGPMAMSTMTSIPVIALMLGTVVFSTCMLIKWLPHEKLDRHSFVGIDNGLTFLYFAFMLVSTIFILQSVGHIMYYMMWLQSYSILLFCVTAVAAALVYLYVLGLMISNIYATYLRAIGMGVPKWKAIMSLPFTLSLLWMPGYLLPDDAKEKQVAPIKSKWYLAFTNWVVAKPVNAVIVFLATLAFSALFFDLRAAYLSASLALIFGIWVWVVGAKNLRKSVGGAFASFAVILNIVMVIALLGWIIFAPKPIANENIQIDTSIQYVDTME